MYKAPEPRYPRKLIDLDFATAAIGRESARERSRRFGNPATLHLWWGRKPLALTRALLFSALVNDPSSDATRGSDPDFVAAERARLSELITAMVEVGETNRNRGFTKEHREIMRSTGEAPPPILDPFCGGGSVAIEAQRLGLEVVAGDLNPVAVLITRAMTDHIVRFVGRPAITPNQDRERYAPKPDEPATGIEGLQTDLAYYANWVAGRALARIGHLYDAEDPDARFDVGMGYVPRFQPEAWIWARTVACPDPSCGAIIPLVRTWVLTIGYGRQWLVPVIDRPGRTVKFKLAEAGERYVSPPNTVSAKGVYCLVCNQYEPYSVVHAAAKEGRLGVRLLACYNRSANPRCWIGSAEEEAAALALRAGALPELAQPISPWGLAVGRLGANVYRDLHTERQLIALGTFSDLIREAHADARAIAPAGGFADDDVPLRAGGEGALAYADAIATYLACVLDKCANFWTAMAPWSPSGHVGTLFSRNSAAKRYQFVEANPFSSMHCGWERVARKTLEALKRPAATMPVTIRHIDAPMLLAGMEGGLVCTDIPTEEIDYAALSTPFYVWLRRSIGSIFPDLLATPTPLTERPNARYARPGDVTTSQQKFGMERMRRLIPLLKAAQHPGYPMVLSCTVREADLYAHYGIPGRPKAHWETLIEELLAARMEIVATYPVRTDYATWKLGLMMSTSPSTLVLVCRHVRTSGAASKLTDQEPERDMALAVSTYEQLMAGQLAPADIAHELLCAAIKTYSRSGDTRSRSLRSFDESRTAMQVSFEECLIEIFESRCDGQTRRLVAWFNEFGRERRTTSRLERMQWLMDINLDTREEARRVERPAVLMPPSRSDELSTVSGGEHAPQRNDWYMLHAILADLSEAKNIKEAGAIMEALQSGAGERARRLACWLYIVCRRKCWTVEAHPYNALLAAYRGFTHDEAWWSAPETEEPGEDEAVLGAP